MFADLLICQEFGIPLYPPPKFPEETTVDGEGRIWYSRWALLGFLERRYATSDDDMQKMMEEMNLNVPSTDDIKQGRGLKPRSRGKTFYSNI